jgi:glyoxylase-like metal-dependent hydrolase (beta-lactamase superfamily II)
MEAGGPSEAAGSTGHGIAGTGEEGSQLDPAEVWRRVTEAGIRLLRIPTPFAVGRVNTYLIEDDPLTLIDSGPNSGKALDELGRQLDALGRSIEELELIIVSHQHIDHMGLVDIIAKRSGAEVAAIDILAPFLSNFAAEAELDDRFAADLMREHGIPDDVVTALRSVSGTFRGWGSRAEVTRALRDGETIELRDRRLEVQLRPGHSPSDTLFWDAERRILFGADHLLGNISSNPLLSRPLDGSTERPKALLNYLANLRRTRELPAEIVLPGHGEPVTDHVKLIDSRLAMHERRAERLLELISREPMTAYQLAQRLWGNVAVTQAFLTLSEVIGHMDLLIQRDLATESRDEGTIIFSATAGAGNPARPEG